MILADTAVWIDHLHAVEPWLVELLGNDEIGCHPLVIEELALGSLKQRDHVLDMLANLYQFPVLTHHEVLHFIDGRRLWGRGLSTVDVNLAGSASLGGGGQLWTRDKRLRNVCGEAGIPVVDA